MLSQYSSYIHKSRYARWIEAAGRRESWEETVKRLMDFYTERFPEQSELFQVTLYSAIVNREIMPSMRSLMTAGPALERENIAAYNCYYHAINHPRKFSETLYILMCGTGVGFGCEAVDVDELPVIPRAFIVSSDPVQVADSKKGWAKAYKKLIQCLYDGEIPVFDYSKVRPAGARLHTFGGRASGPEPLRRLMDFTIKVFVDAAGRKLRPLEVHDIMCMIGEVVVVGGVRRSALISLSDLGDADMRNAKAGQWWDSAAWRSLANNSAVYTHKPSAETFLEEWLSLVKSKSGERGIFNREAAQKQAQKYGRDGTLRYGCNPCSEIILRDGQFCNLTEVCVREDDTFDTLLRKVELATILGTFQSTLTDFKFLGAEAKRNTDEERLLGVSLTGVFDNPLLYKDPNGQLEVILRELRLRAREVNAEWASVLGIPESASITCVKPSGTVSQLCDTASGLHPRHAKQYLRTTRLDKKDPLYRFLVDQGLYIEDDAFRTADTAVVYFPQRAPKSAVTRADLTAIQHLELWLTYQRHWCEHKPSVTISVREHEWPEVGAWVYKHFDEVSGISFLPYSDHTYKQAPYTDISEEELKLWEAVHPMPELNWEDLELYEQEDNTTGTQEYACVGNSCEIP